MSELGSGPPTKCILRLMNSMISILAWMISAHTSDDKTTLKLCNARTTRNVASEIFHALSSKLCKSGVKEMVHSLFAMEFEVREWTWAKNSQVLERFMIQ